MHQFTQMCAKAIAMHANVCYHHGVKRKITQMSALLPGVGSDVVRIKLVGKLIITRFHSYINEKSHKGVKIIECNQLHCQSGSGKDR